jgi:hypothetical protein
MKRETALDQRERQCMHVRVARSSEPDLEQSFRDSNGCIVEDILTEQLINKPECVALVNKIAGPVDAW